MVIEDKNAMALPSRYLSCKIFPQTVQCSVETNSTDSLTCEEDSSNRTPLASQMNEAIILSSINCSELPYCRGVYACF
jgi:hypothetical protein